MNKKHFLLLFVVCLVPFGFYFFHEGFGGYDSYYFLNQVCKPDFELFQPGNVPPLALIVFNELPCNELFLKAVLFFLFFSSVLAISFTGELLNKQIGWTAGFFSFLTPILWRNSLKLENDSFAFPFLFLSAYFFFRYALFREKKSLLVSVFCVLIASGFWGGSLYQFFGFALMEPFFIGISGIFALLFGHHLIANAFPQKIVLENDPTGAIINLMFFLPAINHLKTFFYPATVFFVFFGLANPKFLILALPFVCLTFLKFVSAQPKIFKYAVVLSVLFSISFGAATFLFDYYPTQNEFQAVKFGVEKAQDLNLKLYNDWEWGYLVEWFDGKASAWGGKSDLNYSNGIVITSSQLDCDKLLEKDYRIDIEKIIVYKC